MKKITTTFIFMIFTSVLFSQQFGIKTGLNLTNVYGDDKVFIDDDFTNPLKPGVNVAGFAQFGYGPLKFNVQAGISQKGFIMKDQIGGDSLGGSVKVNSTYHLNYIDINTSGNYFVSDMLSLNAGFGLLLLVNGKNTVKFYEHTGDYIGLFSDYENDAEIGEDLSGVDFGVNLGTTFYITESLLLDANYYLGLATLDPYEDSSIYNNSINISCGYIF